MSSSPAAFRSHLPGGFALLLAACPPPVASEDIGDPLTGSSSTTKPTSDSPSDTDATPTSGADPTCAPSPATTGDTSTSSTSTDDTTAGDTGTTADTSTTGTGLEPPPGCDAPIVHAGDLTITDDTVLEDLQCIVEVTGRLTIGYTEKLVSFAPLANLKRVGDSVKLFHNLALVDLDGLAGLERVDSTTIGEYGQLWIHHHPALTDITGLKSLRHIDEVNISKCDALTDLTGLTGDIDGILTPTWTLALFNNAGLTDLAGLTGITGLESIACGGNPNLADITALSTVLSPTARYIGITGNPALQDLHGLDNVVAVRLMYLIDNDGLVDLTGLDALQKIEHNGLVIEGNAQLVTLDGLDALDEVAELLIEDNPKLASLAALANVTHVPLGLILGRCGGPGNDSLVDLHGLEGLVEMQYLMLNENDALQSIAALPVDLGLDGILAFNNPQLPHAALADYVADAGISQTSQLCNNKGAPAVCECPILTD